MKRFLLLTLSILMLSGIGAIWAEDSEVEAPVLVAETLLPSEVEKVPASPLETTFRKIVDYPVLGFTAGVIGRSLLIILITLICRSIVLYYFFKYLAKLSKKRNQKFFIHLLEKMEKPISSFILLFGLFLAISVFPAAAEARIYILNIYRGASMLIFAWGLMRFSDVFIDEISERLNTKGSGVVGFLPLIRRSIQILIGIIGLLMVIDNLGYQVSGILATLGIGGAAIAFASKDTVANFFGSLCIVLDRPFKVGDWIEVNSKLNGEVLSIGFRSTRIKTFMATTLSIPNSVLANEVVNNWSKMSKRRVKQVLGISYETDPEAVQQIVKDIKYFLKNDGDIHQDFILVSFTDFGESSLDIIVYYFTKTTKWLEYMDVRERINLELIKIVKANGSSIAFPSRMLYFGENASAEISSQLPR